MKGKHCVGLNWRSLAGYVSLNQYNVFLSYPREEIRLVDLSKYDALWGHGYAMKMFIGDIFLAGLEYVLLGYLIMRVYPADTWRLINVDKTYF